MAKCSGSWRFSWRLIRFVSADGSAATIAADLVGQVERDRREDVVACAVADEEVGYGTMSFVVAVPARGPADDLELVVAAADAAAAGVGQ